MDQAFGLNLFSVGVEHYADYQCLGHCASALAEALVAILHSFVATVQPSLLIFIMSAYKNRFIVWFENRCSMGTEQG